jgi:sulfur carrier protein ThiS
MRHITLVIVPGDGASLVQVSDGTTLAQFAADHGLNGRQLIVDGEGVPVN